MRDRYIPAFITLIAGAITCIIDIYRKAELLPSLKRLLLVLIIFYFIGMISRSIIRKVLVPEPKTPEEEEDGELIEISEEDTEEDTEESSDDNL